MNYKCIENGSFASCCGDLDVNDIFMELDYYHIMPV